MCGIVGYVGHQKSIKNLIEKLKLLEYRGYDSAGVYAQNNGKEILIKSVGNISSLEKSIKKYFIGEIMIAHTRWATHGKPSEKNCHPHFSNNKEWIIVHNGIIENYKQLKAKLIKQPAGETDTEVLCQFIEENNATDIDSFIDVFKEVQGSYAVAAINKNSNSLFLAKQKSPLYIAKTDNGFLCASDICCFEKDCAYFYELEDGQFAQVSKNKCVFFDTNKKILQKTPKNIEKTTMNGKNDKYSHFMLKEIYEQPQAIKDLVMRYKNKNYLHFITKNYLKDIDNILILGCGTAYHAALMGVRFIEEIANIKASAEISSEFIYKNPKFISEKSLVIIVSQSGETADSLKALEISKSLGAKTVAITNVEYSSIARKTDFLLPVCAGAEKAVASTKAYVCQLCIFYLLANKFNFIYNKKPDNSLFEIEKISNHLFDFNISEIDGLADIIKNKNDCIFIGKNLDYITATEASLKLKEVSYINSSSYPSGELKHGFLALVESGTPLFVFALESGINQKSLNAAAEAEARGAMKIIITNENLLEEKNAKIIKINEKNKYLSQIMSIIPMQYLAFKVSILKNINPDQPRNLAKSVTVE